MAASDSGEWMWGAPRAWGLQEATGWGNKERFWREGVDDRISTRTPRGRGMDDEEQNGNPSQQLLSIRAPDVAAAYTGYTFWIAATEDGEVFTCNHQVRLQALPLVREVYRDCWQR